MSSSMKNVEGYIGSTDLFKIDPRKIVVKSGWNPRFAIARDALEDLKNSIKQNGFYPDKPVLLYRRGAELELISGHRRLQAVLELLDEGVPIVSIPAVLDQSGDEGERLGRALAANQNGVALEPVDEANAFKRLTGYGWESKRIAEKVGRSLSYVYGRLKLLEATSEVLDAAGRGEITQTDIVRTVERANRNGVSQGVALDETIQKRRAPKKDRADTRIYDGEAHRALLQDMLDARGVVWVVGVLLEYTDKVEVLDAIHDVVAMGVV